MTQKKHVAVLMGGLSSEREVSFSTAEGVMKALKNLGYKVSGLDVGRDVAERLAEIKPDIAFNALHGTYGEDGCIQGVLEFLQIPYTHSGVLASALAMHKQQAKYIFQSADILCPAGKVVTREHILKNNVMKRPYVVKPICNGSSVGVHLVLDETVHITDDNLLKDEEFLVEQYIPGKELSVAVMDDKPLGVVELRAKQGFYDYSHKYTGGMTEHVMPAQVDKRIYDEAMVVALKAHRLLGCRGISRSDFRYDEAGDGKLYLLELNTHPGMTSLSLVPEIAQYVGISYEDIVQYLVEHAQCQNT